MSKLLMIVTADTNDADYVTRERFVSEAVIEQIKKIWKVVEKEHGKWETGEMGDSKELYYESKMLSLEEIDFFDNYVPHGEHGIHTVESIVVHEVVKTTRL